MNIALVAGARPNFIKVMPIIREFNRHPKRITHKLIHTGQHYDVDMSYYFFRDLKIPKPDVSLGVGSGPPGLQTARIIEGIEKVFLKEAFDLVMVVGDVNSTIASALAASKLGIKVAHVEAGLRSFDRAMPEEINRILTDHISDYLFTTEESANKNLAREGIDPARIFFVGDVMIDSYLLVKRSIQASDILTRLGLRKGAYAVATIHRPSNVDNIDGLKRIFEILDSVGSVIQVVLPMHPRTKKMADRFGLKTAAEKILSLGPLGYIDFQNLMENSRFVMTDSGSIQVEATIAGVPCLTLRTTTERIATLKDGTNELTGPDREKILDGVARIAKGQWKKAKGLPLWDGSAAGRITEVLLKQSL